MSINQTRNSANTTTLWVAPDLSIQETHRRNSQGGTTNIGTTKTLSQRVSDIIRNELDMCERFE